jgi:hypothetical protein
LQWQQQQQLQASSSSSINGVAFAVGYPVPAAKKGPFLAAISSSGGCWCCSCWLVAVQAAVHFQQLCACSNLTWQLSSCCWLVLHAAAAASAVVTCRQQQQQQQQQQQKLQASSTVSAAAGAALAGLLRFRQLFIFSDYVHAAT